MGVRKIVEVYCDGCDTAWTDYGSAAELRQRMRDTDGWSVNRPGGQDLCATCKAEADR